MTDTDIRVATTKLFKKDYHIDESVTAFMFENGLLQYHLAKKILIKSEYKKKSKPKCKTLLKCQLAEKYNISFESVEKIIAIKG